MSKQKRIFVGLSEVAGYFSGLREGLEELGFDVLQVDESANRYGYGGAARGSRLGSIADRLHADDQKTSGVRRGLGRSARWGLRAARLPGRLAMLEEAVRTCDVFVFGGGQSFLAGHDLRLIRRAGKRIVWVFTGSDHRPPFLNGKIVRHRIDDPARLIAESNEVRRRVRHVEGFAHSIIAHGPSAQFHSRPFAEFLSVGSPVSSPTSATDVDVGPWPGPPGVRVLHCPTDPAKGSALIRRSIDRLTQEGLALSYLELSGRPNSEVLARLAQADLAVDEVFSDTPMGVFAAEAAAVGVPAVVGSYWAPELSDSLPARFIPPSAFVPPDAVDRELERLVGDEVARSALGEAARQFVRSRWQPDQVAQKVIALANGEDADVVVRDPSDLSYCAGWGMSSDTRRRVVSSMLRVGQQGALGLAHNPALEAHMLSGQTDGVEGDPDVDYTN